MDVNPTQIAPRSLGGDLFAVVVSGELDVFVAPELEESLAEILREHVRLVVVDLVDATFVDSTGVGVLLGARNALASRGGGMVLVTESPAVEMILALMGIDDMFEVVSLTSRAERPVPAAAY